VRRLVILRLVVVTALAFLGIGASSIPPICSQSACDSSCTQHGYCGGVCVVTHCDCILC
jgi:hypothetical protein